MLKNSAPLTTTTKAIVKIKINTGTPLINSIYVLEIVLAIMLSEMRPIPDKSPKNNAIKNEIIVDKKVIEKSREGLLRSELVYF